ncbi:MAG: DUF349 domain-containing protein, partial [Comamonadaceae bacterium]
AAAPLPPVPVWADELRQARGLPAEAAAPRPPKPPKAPVDPEVRAKATQAVTDTLAKLEQEIAQGHGKASAGVANALRAALKEHGKLIDDKLETKAHAALTAAGEMEGWQRWRADQLRQELVAKAEALFEPVAPKPEGGKRRRGAAAEAPQALEGTDPVAAPETVTAASSETPTADTGAETTQADTTSSDVQPVADASGAAAETPAVEATPEASADEGAAAQAETAASPSAEEPATEAPAAEATAADVAPEAVPATATAPAPAAPAAAGAGKATTLGPRPQGPRKPRYGGRKMQEMLRSLRDQWKQVDQGGPPNHALWKRFDEACNEAYKVVQEWLDKVKSEAAENRASRLALIEEVKAWAAENREARDGDWKGFNRI